jgi:hypothetical protein
VRHLDDSGRTRALPKVGSQHALTLLFLEVEPEQHDVGNVDQFARHPVDERACMEPVGSTAHGHIEPCLVVQGQIAHLEHRRGILDEQPRPCVRAASL